METKHELLEINADLSFWYEKGDTVYRWISKRNLFNLAGQVCILKSSDVLIFKILLSPWPPCSLSLRCLAFERTLAFNFWVPLYLYFYTLPMGLLSTLKCIIELITQSIFIGCLLGRYWLWNFIYLIHPCDKLKVNKPEVLKYFLLQGQKGISQKVWHWENMLNITAEKMRFRIFWFFRTHIYMFLVLYGI